MLLLRSTGSTSDGAGRMRWRTTFSSSSTTSRSLEPARTSIMKLFLVYSTLWWWLMETGCCFMLDGTSHAQFPKWNAAAVNGSLEFEFRTEQGNGLLLYTDDGGTYDFFEVKLVENSLRLRYNLGGGAQILTVGHDLGDGHWHKVHISRDRENTTMSIDGIQASSSSRGKDIEFGKLAGNSDVYVGGMPTWYNNKLTLLALPSVIFEPRFNGLIRNLIYADGDSALPRRQEIRSTRSSSSSSSEVNAFKVILEKFEKPHRQLFNVHANSNRSSGCSGGRKTRSRHAHAYAHNF